MKSFVTGLYLQGGSESVGIAAEGEESVVENAEDAGKPKFRGRRGKGASRGGGSLFERFTDRARRVVVLAQVEARLINHNYIGTEHLLLGLISEAEGAAYLALTKLGVSLERSRHLVLDMIGTGSSQVVGHIPFTPRAKKVLELSLREALSLGHNYIGTEHLLLGLIREGQGVAAQVLKKQGVDHGLLREVVLEVLSGREGPGVTGVEEPAHQIDRPGSNIKKPKAASKKKVSPKAKKKAIPKPAKGKPKRPKR